MGAERPNIITVTGEPGSGKDTACEFLGQELNNVEFFKFSDPLTEALNIFCDIVTRADQQWLVGRLRERFGENVLGEAIKKKIKNCDADWVILNGLRKWSEFEMVKKLGGKTIYVTASPKLRWQRLQERKEKDDDQDSFQKFLKKEKDQAERQIPKIGKKADFQINNNGSKEKLKKEVKKIVQKLRETMNNRKS